MTSGWARFAWRVTAAHMATYLVAGLLASSLLNYESWWATEWMDHYRPMDSPWVAAGPALQVVRGLIFAAVLYPFRNVFLDLEPLAATHRAAEGKLTAAAQKG